ncbi:MAG: H+/Na+-translocating ferredoxin:NAD+ oxidoreductase subunit [Desulfovibrionales bacterium]|jgi:electron transport complex protein RnfG|nr:H+/Na+-translocating ferredoxin:NAD+ oxidoreductase subunit [Desulfovibrionales bacterium]
MKEMIKMVVVLSVLCAISGSGLAALKQVTEPIIEEQVLTYVQAPAIESVLTGYDNDPIKDRKKFEYDGQVVMVFPAIKDGKLIGVALETASKGFGGQINVMVGFDVAAGALSGIGITTMKETPGIGSRVAESGFTAQFQGHPLKMVELKSKGGDIDAIAGATISSTGTVNAVQNALAIYNSLKDQFAQSWS